MTAPNIDRAEAAADAIRALVRALQLAVPDFEERSRIVALVHNYGDAVRAATRETWRCSHCLDEPRRPALAGMRDGRTARNTAGGNPMNYRCSVCGSDRVQFSFPVWIPANDMDRTDLFEVDWEAQPEKDQDRTWCENCGEHVFAIASDD